MRSRRRGFTLLELIVAISLMALIAGSLYGSLYVGFRAQRAGANAVAPARIGTLALELLRQDFQGALPPTGVLAGAFNGTAGTGTGASSSLAFYSCANAPSASETGCDIRKVELSVETPADDTVPVLMRRVTTNLLASSTATTREHVLCRRVRSFSVRYYDGMIWQDTWDSAGQGDLLPVAVEVTLESASVAERQDDTEQTYRLACVYVIPCGRAAGTN